MMRMRMVSAAALRRRFERMPQRVLGEMSIETERLAAAMRRTAVNYIGHERPTWTPLAARTVREKRRLGYGWQISRTDPLLRRRDMRDSIKSESGPMKAAVGSESKVARWQELGTRGGRLQDARSAANGPTPLQPAPGDGGIPARSFIWDAMQANVRAAMIRAAVAVLRALEF